MVRLHKCGHPTDWSFKLVGAGKRFTYCLGCLIEKIELHNLDGISNPYIKHEKETTVQKPKDAIVGEEKIVLSKEEIKKLDKQPDMITVKDKKE